MNNYTKLLNNLELLKLNKIKENLDKYVELVNNKEKDVIEILYELTNLEIKVMQDKKIMHSIQFAGFPYLKGFEDFDFTFQPSINKEEILDFKNLRFIDKAENILFVGSPGVGKTHLATAIGIENARNNHSTYFINCNDLIQALKKANIQNRLEDKLKTLTKYKLLIIDEIGYLPIDIEGANLLFQLINRRYERNSTIITTNKAFSKWGELFGDATIANAILDRLIHHSHIINITGQSYRLKNKVKLEIKDTENK